MQLDVIAGVGRHIGLAAGDLRFQIGDVRVDGLVFTLLLEGEFQLPRRALAAHGFLLFRLDLLLLFLRAALRLVIAVIAGIALNRAVLAHGKYVIGDLVEKIAVVRYGQHRPGE